MKRLLLILFIGTCFTASAQKPGKERVPSYFGFRVAPVFPTRFIGSPNTYLEEDGWYTDLNQMLGYSFGGTVRAGVKKLIAIETGINFTQRQFSLETGVPDSNSYAYDTLSFIEYDMPINALFYIQLSEKIYADAALGVTVTYKPTDIGVLNQPGGKFLYQHTGLVMRRTSFDFNANLGFEYRTEKKGFFYIGGAARVPISPLISLIAEYKYDGHYQRLIGDVDGSFLSLEFKYFFPNIKNKGQQFNEGPIQ